MTEEEEPEPTEEEQVDYHLEGFAEHLWLVVRGHDLPDAEVKAYLAHVRKVVENSANPVELAELLATDLIRQADELEEGTWVLEKNTAEEEDLREAGGLEKFLRARNQKVLH